MAARKWLVQGLMVAAVAVALAACGGGGTSSGTTSMNGSAGGGAVTIQGVLPGSVFVAVDDDTNAEVQRAAATGTPKTFSMTIPTGKTYRFYMIENEAAGNGARVYPYYAGSTNVIALMDNSAGQTIDLGTVVPDLSTGNAMSTNDFMSHAGIVGRGTSGMMPPSLSGAMFSMDNLAGTWRFNTLSTSGMRGWTHGSLAIDNSGFGFMSGIVRNGSSMPSIDNIPYMMSPSGAVRIAGDNTFRCVLSKDFSLMVATFTDNNGGYSLMMAQRPGASYAAADLDGTWNFHRMTAGADNITSGWAYGSMPTTGGAGTIAAITTDNGSVAEIGRGFTFTIGADGIVTAAGNPSFHGAMSADKNMIVATDNSGSGYNLWILMKTGGTYSTADLTGDWMMNGLVSGNAGAWDWNVGQSVIGSGGVLTYSQMMGHGGMMSWPQSTLTLNSGGAITMSGGSWMGGGMWGGGMMGPMMGQTYHGTMSSSKGMMVSTYSDGTGGYRFSIQMK